jgi:hypothetical protein
MWKAVAAALVSFSMGGAAMTVLGTLLGGYAEPAALGLVGLGLMASGQLLGARIPSSEVPEVARAPESKVGV